MKLKRKENEAYMPILSSNKIYINEHNTKQDLAMKDEQADQITETTKCHTHGHKDETSNN